MIQVSENVNICAPLLALPRGSAMFAAVLGVLHEAAHTVTGLAAWMHRTVREVRRILTQAARAGVLPATICAY